MTDETRWKITSPATGEVLLFPQYWAARYVQDECFTTMGETPEITKVNVKFLLVEDDGNVIGEYDTYREAMNAHKFGTCAERRIIEKEA